MKFRILTIVFFSTLLSFSQGYNAAMPVSKSDLELTSYAKDSTANALVIYDYGNTFVDTQTFWLRFQFEQKVKVLRPEGIDRGVYEIKLYKGKSSEEKILNIKGVTYNLEDGKTVKSELSKSAIFKEEYDKYTLVKFVLPNVKVGSVITVSYETQSRFMTKYQPWYFQGKDPVLYSEYNTKIPANYDYHIKLVGGIPLETHDMSRIKNCINLSNGARADCSVSKYLMRNIPAYKPEDFTTTALNYISRVEFELSVFNGFDGRVNKITKTWKDTDKELRTDSNFGRQISKKNLVKNILPDSISTMTDQLSKAKAIYQFVTDNYTWNKKSERYDVSVKRLKQDKLGSSFEINLLLENLLYSEGFEVFPILMSTRKNGFATKVHPVLTDFNYVILKTIIDGESFFLDATNPYLSFGELPFRALNQYGRLMDFKDGSYWEDVKVEDHSLRIHRLDFTSFKDEKLMGNVVSKYGGYHSHQPKRRFDENPTGYLERKINQFPDIAIENHTVIDYDKKKTTFEESFDISIEPEFIGNKIYLNPFILKFFKENPFKLQERTYPIDFGYKDIYNFSMRIGLGNELKVLETPTSVSYSLPNKSGNLLFNTEVKENELILYFNVKFDLPIYAPEYYPYLKQFMAKVVEIQNNSLIILEKQ